jgi:hypothetical protein
MFGPAELWNVLEFNLRRAMNPSFEQTLVEVRWQVLVENADVVEVGAGKVGVAPIRPPAATVLPC